MTVLPLRSSTDYLKVPYIVINLPLIPSLMNPLVQTFSHSPENYGIDMQVGLMVIPHQTRK